MTKRGDTICPLSFCGLGIKNMWVKDYANIAKGRKYGPDKDFTYRCSITRTSDIETKSRRIRPFLYKTEKAVIW